MIGLVAASTKQEKSSGGRLARLVNGRRLESLRH